MNTSGEQGPRLGLATTRQLLQEIRARGETERYRNRGYGQLGDDMAIGAANLLESLPGAMLEYRTVDQPPRPRRQTEQGRGGDQDGAQASRPGRIIG